MDGRWTLVHVDLEESLVYGPPLSRVDGDAAVPVVPCDDAAVERAANRVRELEDASDYERATALDSGDWAEYVAREVLRAAGESSQA